MLKFVKLLAEIVKIGVEAYDTLSHKHPRGSWLCLEDPDRRAENADP